MLSLALDETTGFETKEFEKTGLEGSSALKGPVMIAGLLYDDKDAKYEEKNEKYRIRDYLQKACDHVGTLYPADLHVNHNGDNKGQVGRTKAEIAATLQEFITSGTYRGELLACSDGVVGKRTGQYYVFAELKSTAGITGRIHDAADTQKTAGNLSADDYASNLYLHMTGNAVTRVLFHNPWIDTVRKVSLYLPTRTLPVNAKDRKQYEKLYDKQSLEGEHGISLVSKDFYRTAMEREMETVGRNDLEIAFMRTEPILYEDVYENRLTDFSFLYMADIICSNLEYAMKYAKDGDTPAAWMGVAKQWCENTFGSDHCIVFGYDDMDMEYLRAENECRRGNIYGTLEMIWQARGSRSEFAQQYNTFWFEHLTERIQNWNQPDDLADAIRKLERYARTSNLNQQKLLFLFDILKKAIEHQHASSPAWEALYYDFCHTGIAVYNHIGDDAAAQAMYQKCMQKTASQSTDTILRSRSRMAVAYMDAFAYEKAQALAKQSLEAAEQVSEARGKLAPREEEDLTYGIALSQYAQTLACMRAPETDAAFKAALRQMKKDGANYNITLSYYLHSLLDRGEYDRYRLRAKEYFGGNAEPSAQFAYLLKQSTAGESKLTIKFALYVYLRAAWLCSWERTSQEVREQVLFLPATLKKYHLEEQMSGHPWELNYKYLALLSYRAGKISLAEEYIRKSTLAEEEKSTAIEAVIHNGLLEYAEYTKNAQLAQKERKKLSAMNRDISKFTFMYH